MNKALILPLFVVILAFGLPSSAAMAKADKPKAAPAEPMIQLSPVALPIVRDGRVINYVFVSIKILLTPKADATVLSEKEPYFRDVLIRAAHRTPLGAGTDPNRVDEPRLKAAIMQGAGGFMDVKLIKGIQIMFQTPKRRLPTPSAQQPATPH